MTERHEHAGVRFPPPLVFLGFLLLGLAAGVAIGRPGLGLPSAIRLAAGGLVLAAGLLVIIVAVAGFRRAGTRPEPWEPTTAIVETGLYGRTRNPMYLGMALIHAGIALLADSLTGLATLPFALYAIQTQVIAREERYLEAKFGEPYRTYKRRVRRWL